MATRYDWDDLALVNRKPDSFVIELRERFIEADLAVPSDTRTRYWGEELFESDIEPVSSEEFMLALSWD